MWRNRLKIKNEQIFVIVLFVAIIAAGVRDLWLLNQFSKENNTFILYQDLEQNFSALHRDFYRIDGIVKQIEKSDFLIQQSSALLYTNNALNLILKSEAILEQLKPYYDNASILDFTDIQADFQRYILFLENSSANIIELQAVHVKIANNLDKINDQLLILAEEMQAKHEKSSRLSMAITLVFMFISIFLLFFFVRWQNNRARFSRNHIMRKLTMLASGNLADVSSKKIKNELNLIESKIMELSAKFANLQHSIDALGKEDFDGAKNMYPFAENSFLGASYHQFIELIKKKESELLQEKNKIDWQLKINDALSDIEREMRENVSSDKLYALILQKIIKFIGINQGGFFVIQKNKQQQEVLVLEASYAYNYERMIKKEILISEGLLGTCAKEQQMIVLNHVPQNYIEITSGLGEKNPQHLILLPIVYQKKTIAVIELASFFAFNNQIITYLNEATAIIALFLVNRQKDEQTVLDFFLVKNDNLAEDLTDDDLGLVNQKLSNWFYGSIPVAFFDKSGNLITFNHRFAEIMPRKIIANYTTLNEIIEGDLDENVFLDQYNEANRIFVRGMEMSDLLFYNMNCKGADKVANIIFASNLNKID